MNTGGQERSDAGMGTGGQERSDAGIGTGGQERSDAGIGTGGQERSDWLIEDCLADFDQYLALERGRSEHTRRAYLGDLRALFEFLAERSPGAGLQAMT